MPRFYRKKKAELSFCFQLKFVKKELKTLFKDGTALSMDRAVGDFKHGTWGSAARSIEKLHNAELLGPDLNFAHANAVSPEEIKLLAEHGGSVSVTPEIEMMMGHGCPATGLCLKNGVNPAWGRRQLFALRL